MIPRNHSLALENAFEGAVLLSKESQLKCFQKLLMIW